MSDAAFWIMVVIRNLIDANEITLDLVLHNLWILIFFLFD